MTAAGRALMSGLVDYAGLFPPAGLAMLDAVRHYRKYLNGADKWALGKFVVPVSRLREFEAAFEEASRGEREPVWPLSALESGEAAQDAVTTEALALGAVSIDAIEIKAASTADAERLLAERSSDIPIYVEFPPGEAKAVLPVLARFGARAKIRTGGVAAEAIPSVEAIADFLMACARARLRFKATAGLHHAIRDRYKLTYEPQGAQAVMHGFANVFLAAVLAWRGAEKKSLIETLEAREFSFGDEGARWLGSEVSTDEIVATRSDFAMSYGSCSFAEPLEEARTLGWI